MRKQIPLLVFCSILLFVASCQSNKDQLIRDLNETSQSRRATKLRKTYDPDRGAKWAPEFRGVWMSRFSYDSPEDITMAVKNLKDYNFNALVLQVRENGTCFFDSRVEPWAEELGGKNPGWDPLALAVNLAHKNGIELHAWINTMPGWTGTKPPKNPDQLWNAHPDWFMIPYPGKPAQASLKGGYAFLNPCNPHVRNYISRLADDMARRYQLDGVHFDHIRFPGFNYSYDRFSVSEFESLYKGIPEDSPEKWACFRRDCLTRLLSRSFSSLKQTRPKIIVSAATWGNPSDGFENYFQDSHGWLAKGILDVSMPMIYRTSEKTFQRLVTKHVLGSHHRRMYPGIGSYLITDPSILLSQVKVCRDLNTQGMVFFDYSSLFKDHLPTDLADALLKGPFREEIATPSYPWLEIKDDDSKGPIIDEISLGPYPVMAGETFYVQCEITDPSGVFDSTQGAFEKGVHLVYDTNPLLSNGKEATLSLKKESIFITDKNILAPSNEQFLYFRINAWDNDTDIEEGNEQDKAAGTSKLMRIGIHHKLEEYRFLKNLTKPRCGLQYPDSDSQDRIWVCARNHNQILIFLPGGTLAPSAPINEALDENGKTIPVLKPAGLAIDIKKHIAYVCSGNLILRFNSNNESPLPAIKTTSTVCSDADVDSQGNIYVANGIRRRWMKFDPDGKPMFDREIAPVPKEHASYDNPSLSRGIAVTPDGEFVYLLSQDDECIDVYRYNEENNSYTYEGNFSEAPVIAQALDVGPDKRIYTSERNGMVKVYSMKGKWLGDITGGEPPLITPCGICFSSNSTDFYIVQNGRFQSKASIQKWTKD